MACKALDEVASFGHSEICLISPLLHCIHCSQFADLGQPRKFPHRTFVQIFTWIIPFSFFFFKQLCLSKSRLFNETLAETLSGHPLLNSNSSPLVLPCLLALLYFSLQQVPRYLTDILLSLSSEFWWFYSLLQNNECLTHNRHSINICCIINKLPGSLKLPFSCSFMLPLFFNY